MNMDKRTNEEPLKGKRFFMDPNLDKGLSLKIKESIELLGGKVEAFLDKTIHFAITNQATVKKDKAKLLSSPLPMSNSPFGTSQTSSNIVTNRWKDLARRANTTASTLNSVLNTAKILGIKIRHVDEVWSWLAKKTETRMSTAPPSVSSGTKIPNEIILKHPCIKLEDHKYKPTYEELTCFPYFGSLCKGDTNHPILLTKTTDTKKSTNKKKSNEQKGFCECCRSSYLNDGKHRKSVQHINYGENASHFLKLDQYIARNNLGLEMFLKRELQNHDSPAKHLRSSTLKTPEKQLETSPLKKTPLQHIFQSNKRSSPKSCSTSKKTSSTSPTKNLFVTHRYSLRSPKSRNILSNTSSPMTDKLSHSSKRKRNEDGDSIADCSWTRLDFTPEKPTSNQHSSHMKPKLNLPIENNISADKDIESKIANDISVDKDIECFVARKRLRSFTKLNEAIKSKVNLPSTKGDHIMMQLLHTSEQDASEFWGF